MLNYDKHFPKFQDGKFCEHVISVAIKYELLESYLANDVTLTKIASQNCLWCYCLKESKYSQNKASWKSYENHLLTGSHLSGEQQSIQVYTHPNHVTQSCFIQLPSVGNQELNALKLF